MVTTRYQGQLRGSKAWNLEHLVNQSNLLVAKRVLRAQVPRDLNSWGHSLGTLWLVCSHWLGIDSNALSLGYQGGC